MKEDAEKESESDATEAGIGPRLLRFAIFADTHLTAEDGVSPSPWKTNALANARARAAVAAINRFAPAFTIHLGDMVHPVPAQASYGPAAERAREIFAGLDSPLYYVPGNHDIGDKPLDWMPAEVVSEAFAATYEAHFGADRAAFDHEGCRFVLLDASILNTGLEREAVQWRWLERVLADTANRRLFVFSHYPPYIAAPDEMEHYDNLGEPARGRLLALLSTHRVEACFAAHVHNIFWDRQAGTDLYVVPAVSAIRHDYSELFRVPPTETEFGRDDNPKLGVVLVDVHARGHAAHHLRSYGATLPPAAGGTPAEAFRAPAAHSRLRAPCPVGVDMRQGWAAPVAITPGGAVDEFTRKQARDDYAIAALWEMGIRKIRVPLDDLIDPSARRRLEILQETGTEILLSAFGVPEGSVAEAIAAHAGLFEAVELILPTARLAGAMPSIRAFRERTGLPVYQSRLRSSAEAEAAGATYTHFITHGFGSGEDEAVAELMALPGAADAVSAVTFRVAADEEPAARIRETAALVDRLGTRAVLHIALGNANPAVMAADDAALANRVAATLFAASATAGSCIAYLDTFADIDRGYFPRFGLLDRRSNPRPVARVFAELQAALTRLGGLSGFVQETGTSEAAVLAARSRERTAHLVLSTSRSIAIHFAGGDEPDDVEVIDLSSGEMKAMNPTMIAEGGKKIEVSSGGAPLLIVS